MVKKVRADKSDYKGIEKKKAEQLEKEKEVAQPVVEPEPVAEPEPEPVAQD